MFDTPLEFLLSETPLCFFMSAMLTSCGSEASALSSGTAAAAALDLFGSGVLGAAMTTLDFLTSAAPAKLDSLISLLGANIGEVAS